MEKIILCDRCEMATGNYVENEYDGAFCLPCAGYLEAMADLQEDEPQFA